MKENREFNMLENADDKTVELLSEVPVLTKEEKERMLAMSKKKLDRMNRESNINISNNEYEVSGVERYKRPKWHAFASVAACLLLVGGIGGTMFAMKQNKPIAGNDSSLSNVTTTIPPSTRSIEETCDKEAASLLGQYRFVMGLSYGIPGDMELDESDTQEVEDYDGSTVTYYRVADVFSSVNELNGHLETIMTGNLLNEYEALLTRYLGQEPRFKEIDGKLYFRKGGGSLPEYNDYTIENYDDSSNSFDIVTVNAHSSTGEKEIFHVVLEKDLWKIESIRMETEAKDQSKSQEPSKFEKADALQLLSSLDLVDDLMAGGIHTSVDTNDSIEYQSADGSYTVKYNKLVSGGIIDLNNLKKMVKSTVTEPVLSETYSYIYEDEVNDLPMFKEVDGKLYMRDNARGARFNFTGDPELIKKSDKSYEIITDNEVPGGTEKVKITAVYEDGSWKVSDFGYPDDEKPTVNVTADDYSESALMDIAKAAPNMLNEVMLVQRGTVTIDESDLLDNDTIYKYVGVANPGNMDYFRVTDQRFSSRDDICDYITERTTGIYRDGIIREMINLGSIDGFPVYLENEENGKLYSRISRFRGIIFEDDVEIISSTETTMTVRVKAGSPLNEYMLILLEVEDGKWKISGFQYEE